MNVRTSTVRYPELGEVFAGDYEIIELAGVGGYARVFRARAQHSGEELAVKILDPNLDRVALEAFLSRFYREALLTSVLQHPNTVTPIDYGRASDGVPYIVMEYLEGKSVAEFLDAGGRFSMERAQNIVVNVLESLEEAHQHGIVHGDIKSSNIFLQDNNPAARVLDFGVATLIDDEASGTEQVFGTPHYIAPEVAIGKAVTPAADIYSLAIGAYETVHARFPFEAPNPREVMKAHVLRAFPRLAAELRNSPLGRFIERAAAKSPAARPTATEALRILQTGTRPLEILSAGPPTPVHGNPRTAITDIGSTPSISLRMRSPFAGDDVRRPRQRTADRLTELVRRGVKERGMSVILRGPRGVGKERMLRDVLSSENAPIDEDSVFFMNGETSMTADGRIDVTNILEQIPRRFSGFEKLVDPAARIATAYRDDPSDSVAVRRVVEFLLKVAERRPLVWVMTALERADDETANVLTRLIDGIYKTRARMTLVLSLTDDEPVYSRATSYLLRNVKAGVWKTATIVDMPPLSDEAMLELAHEIEPMSDSLAQELVSRSRGLPGRLNALVRAAREQRFVHREHDRLVARLRADLGKLKTGAERSRSLRRRMQSVLRTENIADSIIALSFLGSSFPESAARKLLAELADAIHTRGELDIETAIDRNILAAEKGPDGRTIRILQLDALCELQSDLGAGTRDLVILAAAIVLEAITDSVEASTRAANLFARAGDDELCARCALRGAKLADQKDNLETSMRLYSLAWTHVQGLDSEPNSRLLAEIELGLGRAKLESGAMGAAEELLSHVRDRALSEGDEDFEVRADLELVEIAITRGDGETCARRLPRLAQLARKSDDPSHYVRALVLLGLYSSSVGKRREAARAFVQAEKLAAKEDLGFLRARSRMGIARLLLHEGQYQRALQLLHEAIRYFRTHNHIDLLIESLIARGNMVAASGESGETSFRDAERLAEDHGRGRLLADILAGQGDSMLDDDNLSSASLLFLRALERYRALSHKRGEALTLQRLAETSVKRRQLAAAHTYAAEAIQAFKQARDAVGLARCEVVAAEIFVELREFDNALKCAIDATEQLERIGAGRDVVRAQLVHARILRAAGRDSQATALLANALARAQKTGDKRLTETVRVALMGGMAG